MLAVHKDTPNNLQSPRKEIAKEVGGGVGEEENFGV